MKTLTSPHVLCHKKIKQAMKTLSSPHVLCDKKDKASHRDTYKYMCTYVICHKN